MDHEQVDIEVVQPTDRRHELRRQATIFLHGRRAVDGEDLYWRLFHHIPVYMILMILLFSILYVFDINLHRDFDHAYLDTAYPKQLWRTYTYSLFHADTPHIVNNCVMFFMLGCLLNAAHGNLRIAAINTLGSIGGALAVGFEARDHIRRGAYPLIFRVVGASGGIYSLTGAQLGNLIINWAEVPFRYAHVAVLTMMLLTDLLLYIFMHDSLISYASHGGGFITGVLVGPLLLINVKKRKWEKWVQMAFGVLSSAYFVAGIVNLLTLPEIRA